jgi:secreted trypsin-like serine protease
MVACGFPRLTSCVFIGTMGAVAFMAAGTAGTVPASISSASRQATFSFVVPTIVDGNIAPRAAYPFQVALVEAHTALGREFEGFFCAGTLIDPQWVLTAAHCIVDEVGRIKPGSQIHVYVGSSNFEGGDRIPAAVTYPHYQFDRQTIENDVAVIGLQRPPSQGINFSTIDLMDDAHWFFPRFGEQPDTRVKVIGWGATGKNQDSSRDLREIDLRTNIFCGIDYRAWSRARLQQRLEREFHIGKEKIDQMMAIFDGPPLESPLPPGAMCASESSGQFAGLNVSSKGPCYGDSGGPLIHQEPTGRRVQVGIVSWGLSCDATLAPEVFTNVGYYVDWIKGALKSGQEAMKTFRPAPPR